MIKELVARHEDASINAAVDVFVPDGEDIGEALARTTHLAIGAHPDDLEIMAYHGIAKCYGESGEWFCGVTCTDGAGSSRVGPYAKYTDLEMVAIRQEEQRQAAMVGKYAAMVQLCLPSSAIKEPGGALVLKDDLADILKQARPEVVYTHNPADKHSTHIAVLQGAIRAMHTPRRRRGLSLFTVVRYGGTSTGCRTRTRSCLMLARGRIWLMPLLVFMIARLPAENVMTVLRWEGDMPMRRSFMPRLRTRSSRLLLPWISRHWFRMSPLISLIMSWATSISLAMM